LKLKGEKMLANIIAANGKIDPNGQVLEFTPEWRAVQDKSECFWSIELPMLPSLQFASKKRSKLK